jgi:hypothetical protein
MLPNDWHPLEQRKVLLSEEKVVHPRRDERACQLVLQALFFRGCPKRTICFIQPPNIRGDLYAAHF